MKHLFTLLLIVFASVYFTQAQNVGVGESAPGSKLSVKGNLSVGNSYSNISTNLPINGLVVEGNVGIGTANPATQLHTTGTVRFQGLGGSGVRYVKVDNTGNLTGSTTVPWADITGAPAIGGNWTLTGSNLSPNNLGWNVGIGTASPSERLDIHGNTRIRPSNNPATDIILTNTDPVFNDNVGIDFVKRTNDTVSARIEFDGFTSQNIHQAMIGFYTKSDTGKLSKRMLIDELGNVGIGTGSPITKLHVAGGDVRVDNLGGSGNRYVRTDNNGLLSGTATVPWADITGAPAFITSFTEVDPTWNGAANETGNIGRTGNVGIGTTTPGAKLHIAAPSASFLFDPSPSTSGYSTSFVMDNTGLQIGHNSTSRDFRFLTGSVPRLTITGSGNVGIGRTDPLVSLDVVSEGRVRVNTFPADDVTPGSAAFELLGRAAGGGANIWRMYTAPIGGGFGIPVNSLSFWQYPGDALPGCCIQRFTILPSRAGDSGSPVFIDGNGRLGVGTYNIPYRIEAMGDIRANGGWLRTAGNTGWISDTWGGGWAMADDTWIRSQGNKSIYHNTGIMRTDGTFQVGGGGATFNVVNGGDLSYRTNVLYANTAGNVGIGTTAPSAQLHTTGTVRLQNLGGSGNRYVRTDNNGLLSGTATVPWSDITGAPASITFLASGDVNIGDPGLTTPSVISGAFNIASIFIINGGGADSRYQINFTTPMPNANYFVDVHALSNSLANWNNDNDVIWSIITTSTTGFQIAHRELSSNAQNLRLRFRIY